MKSEEKDAKERGIVLGQSLKKRIVHSPFVRGSLYEAVVLTLYVLMLKYLDDNREHYHLTIPEEIRFKNLAACMPDNVPYASLKDYTVSVQRLMGLDESVGIYEEVELCGFERQKEYVQIIFSDMLKWDFSQEAGQEVALALAEYILNLLEDDKTFGTVMIPHSVITLLAEISEITDGMKCCGITDDSCITLPLLTVGKSCDITVQNRMFNKAAFLMFLILGSNEKSIRLRKNRFGWLPIGLENEMGTFDRVYAFPALDEPMNMKEVFAYSEQAGEIFVENWPENLSCGEWIYARHMVKALKSDGIGFILLPLNSLLKMGIYAEVRESFLHDNLIDAVIELPLSIKNSGMKLALVIIRKNRSSDQVWMISLGKAVNNRTIQMNRQTLSREDAEQVVKVIQKQERIPSVSKQIGISHILENGACLSPGAYVVSEMSFMIEDMEILLQDQEMHMQRLQRVREAYVNAMMKYNLLKYNKEEDTDEK